MRFFSVCMIFCTRVENGKTAKVWRRVTVESENDIIEKENICIRIYISTLKVLSFLDGE